MNENLDEFYRGELSRKRKLHNKGRLEEQTNFLETSPKTLVQLQIQFTEEFSNLCVYEVYLAPPCIS